MLIGTVCGICGAFQIGGERRPLLAPGVLDRMTDTMAHRGPNDRGTYEAPGVALGVRRLSIVDVEHGHQPFSNERGDVWAIQNGELYNQADVRRELLAEGHRFETGCDTEIIPHLYERRGLDFPRDLRGMFGIAVWDQARGTGVLVRDRLGVKPLYYAVVGDTVVFGSELKAVLASGLVSPTLDYEAIDAYLSLGLFPAPLTPLAQVRKLEPGQRLVADPSGRGVRVDQYWTYPLPEPRKMTLDDAVDGLREQLERSVSLRLMSDVPLGAMLSGGLDSSLIVALMAKEMSSRVKTFAVGFAGGGKSNELDDARYVADALGCDHEELVLSFEDQSLDLEALVWHLDEPLADLSSIGFLALSGLAAQHVTVALSGQGADELFGGYRRHRNAATLGHWSRLPGPVQSLAARSLTYAPSRFSRRARILGERDPALRYALTKENMTAKQRARLAVGPLAAVEAGAARRSISRLLGDLRTDPLSTTLYLDARLGLPDDMLHYFDRASMAHSLEVRVPFLDHHLVEYAATIPPELKVRRGVTKYVLKQLATGLVPERIIDKPKVGFFNGAVGAWFRAQAATPIADYLLSGSPRSGAFLDVGAVRGLLDDQRREGSTQLDHLALALLMLEVWLSSYLPRATAAPSTAVAARVTS